MDAQDWGQGLSDEDFADVMSRAFPDAAQPSTEGAAPQGEPPAPTATGDPAAGVQQSATVPPQPAAAEAAPPAAPVAAPTADAASTETPVAPPAADGSTPTPAWDSPENPYYQRSTQAEQILQRIATAAQQQQAQQAQMQQIREQQIAERLINSLPDLDPDQQRLVVTNLMGWKEDQLRNQLATRTNQLESMSWAVAVDMLTTQYGLTPEERQNMAKLPTPEVMEFYAQNRKELREAREQAEAVTKQQIAQLSVQAQAQQRMNSAADTVIDGSGSAPIRPQDADNMDDYFAALVPSLPGNWQR